MGHSFERHSIRLPGRARPRPRWIGLAIGPTRRVATVTGRRAAGVIAPRAARCLPLEEREYGPRGSRAHLPYDVGVGSTLRDRRPTCAALRKTDGPRPGGRCRTSATARDRTCRKDAPRPSRSSGCRPTWPASPSVSASWSRQAVTCTNCGKNCGHGARTDTRRGPFTHEIRGCASEAVCKPSSVPWLAPQGWPSIWGRRLPDGSCGRPEGWAARLSPDRGRVAPSYLALLRVEFAAFHSARRLAPPTGIVTVALVLASRRTGVTRYPALRSSDFPHAVSRVAPTWRATIRRPR
jgi:hypothetical protein